MQSTPLATIETLIDARLRRNDDTAFACYRTDATVSPEKGQTASGEGAIRAFIVATSSLSIRFEAHDIIEHGDVALHTSRYAVDVGDGKVIEGRTADVLVRDELGAWRIAIDNPWAA